MTNIEDTLAERGARYGEFKDRARIAQNIQDAMRQEAGWQQLAADQKQALTVIADKIARMLNGDPDYRDNWHDIVGYAQLVDRRLEREEGRKGQPELPFKHDVLADPIPRYREFARTTGIPSDKDYGFGAVQRP
jgi:hypothetical protein